MPNPNKFTVLREYTLLHVRNPRLGQPEGGDSIPAAAGSSGFHTWWEGRPLEFILGAGDFDCAAAERYGCAKRNVATKTGPMVFIC